MIKVLACLILAMTSTAAVLSWAEPASLSAADAIVPTLAAEQAQRAITTSVPLTQGRWRHVDVVICPDSPAATHDVPAVTDSKAGYHFLVSTNGAVRTGPFWMEQVPIGEYRDAVQIRIGCAADAMGLPLLQRIALQKLLLELNRRCAAPGSGLAVSVQDTSTGDDYHSPLAGAVNRVLADAGLLK